MNDKEIKRKLDALIWLVRWIGVDLPDDISPQSASDYVSSVGVAKGWLIVQNDPVHGKLIGITDKGVEFANSVRAEISARMN